MMTQYRNVALGELSPHVYAIAEQVSLPAPLVRVQIHSATSPLHTLHAHAMPCQACIPAHSFYLPLAVL